VFPAGQQQQIRFQLSMVLLSILSQRLLARSDNQGRVIAVELLINTPAVANMIREGKTHQVLGTMETAAKDGMITMDKSVKDLYLQGLISYDEARSHMRNPKELK
jgi:twitching motility protein PilT